MPEGRLETISAFHRRGGRGDVRCSRLSSSSKQVALTLGWSFSLLGSGMLGLRGRAVACG